MRKPDIESVRRFANVFQFVDVSKSSMKGENLNGVVKRVTLLTVSSKRRIYVFLNDLLLVYGLG